MSKKYIPYTERYTYSDCSTEYTHSDPSVCITGLSGGLGTVPPIVHFDYCASDAKPVAVLSALIPDYGFCRRTGTSASPKTFLESRSFFTD